MNIRYNKFIRGVRVPNKFGYPIFGSGRVLVVPRNNRVPEMIGFPATTSDTHSMWSGTCCNFREILRMIDKGEKFRKFVSTKNL